MPNPGALARWRTEVRIAYDDVALYIGGGQIIHAPHPGGVVQYDSLYYWNTSMMASRP